MTEFDLCTEQVKRQHSAATAMARRQWTIIDTQVDWKVKTPTDTYSIIPHPTGRLVCSCPDSQRYTPLGLECKHACGLRIYLEEGGAPRQQNFKSTGGSTMTTEYTKECGWLRLFHPSAAQVTVPLYRLLRANMYAAARIVTDTGATTVLVPRAAIQEARGVQLVFVQLAADAFEARRVRTRPAAGDMVAITADVRPGERVVTTGSFLLKTETLKESLGTGCCQIEPPRD